MARKNAAATKTQAQGVGESKRFADETKHAPGIDWSKLTINEQPIPEALWGSMPYALTDQGAIEANGGRPLRVRTVEEIVKDRTPQPDALTKAHEARRNAQEKGLPVPLDAARTIANAARSAGSPLDDPNNFKGQVGAFQDGMLNDYLATDEDPQSMVMHECLPVGHRGLWMSKGKTAREGMVRGILRYKQVFRPDGQPVEMGNMFLGSVPIEAYQRQEAHYADINRRRQVQAIDSVREQTDKIASAAKLDRGARRKYQEGTNDGFVDEDREQADREIVEQFSRHSEDDVD